MMAVVDTKSQDNHLDVDIAKSADDELYKEVDGNGIEVKRECSVNILGFKKYIHRPKDKYIGGVRHNKEPLNFPYLDFKSGSYKEVDVYYLDYDEGNVLPLLIGLLNDGGSCDYYKRVKYDTPNSQWLEVDNVGTDGSKITEELESIFEEIKDIVVIKLDGTSGYYTNGDPSQPPKANPTTQVQVTQYTYETVYKKCVHKLPDKKLRVIYTRTSDKNIPFDPPVYGTGYSEVSVYFWEGDSSHAKPLLLELKPAPDTSSYYTNSNGKWVKQEGGHDNLEKNLDKQNCRWNNAYVVNIAKTDSYPCVCCSACEIQVTSVKAFGYIHCMHRVSTSFSVSKVMDGAFIQTGLPISTDIDVLNVYHYPAHLGKPLLIRYSSKGTDHCYMRDSRSKKSWSPVPGDKGITSASVDGWRNFSLLLDLYSPSLVIDIGRNGNGTYSSGDGEWSIRYTRTESPKGYHKVTHVTPSRILFFVKDFQFDGTFLAKVWIKSLVNSISVYFSTEEAKSKTPLMIEAQRKDGEYDYYCTIRNGDNRFWSPHLIHGNEEETLKERLDAIYAMEFPPSHTVAISIGIIVVVCLIIIGAHEGIRMATDPAKSFTARFLRMGTRFV
ncbi:hypothetical protein BEWA_048720 [Theileria equi strain WA]|uniref:Uncharacterized protein n=1 Tax=Theileria equi strain WA TaxID=1537102 RepID=L1LAU5_THEEQ|nr:hypothetical protein BEWA_048720 [Theileria equi strain WA]EKX72405.1 hypothetical protein BEWA_048720 [Theileria equi strain WA]|eukprot:XP_004831857.1 hypothetical protein BEWA_048720 [Theileria equi strain WA]